MFFHVQLFWSKDKTLKDVTNRTKFWFSLSKKVSFVFSRDLARWIILTYQIWKSSQGLDLGKKPEQEDARDFNTDVIIIVKGATNEKTDETSTLLG